jgi:hypothetical protein
MRESGSRLPVASILVGANCEAPQSCGWWGAALDSSSIGGTLRAIPFQEVGEGGVGRDWYRDIGLSVALRRWSPFAFRMNSQICPDGLSQVMV